MSIKPEIVRREAPFSGRPNRDDSTSNSGLDQPPGRELSRRPTSIGMEREPTIGTCATCGRLLTQVGRKGECLRCLVSLGFLGDGRLPESSGVPTRLTPRVLKYDHFEVEIGDDGFPVELGAGAMAVTYRARDTVLNSTVALKVIDRKVAQIPGARSRFLREARAAAQIQHRNVARVTHYGEQDGECFYVMELVKGETLEARVRRDGPMPLALALDVIQQAARALVAAEACGVVHRDIKPSNIMIKADVTGALVVKVIDYGVAKVLAPQAEPGDFQTQAGFIGTPAFASPEQFSEGQTRIDTRSDTYSLGVTFWYLLSGRVPFVGRSFEDIRARQTEQLPLEQLKGLHVPARCVALLKSMLAPDPKDRPQSARELLAAVHRCFTKFSTEARGRKRRVGLATAAVTLVAAAIALGAWMYQRMQSSAAMERSIAVLPFENLSANGEDAYFTIGMQDEITSGLARLSGLKVIGSQSTRSYVPGTGRNLSAIGRVLGVRHLLEGTVSRVNDHLHVALQLVDLRDSGHPWIEAYERSMKDLFALQSEITRAVATRLQTRLSSGENAELNLPSTTDPQAYDLYLQAHALPIELSESATSRFTIQKRAIKLLDQAVARDPNFVLAYCELARCHDDLYFQRYVGPAEELAIDHRGLAEGALEKARRLQPDSGAVHRVLALHALMINRDVEEAALQIELARRTLPNDAEVETTAGRVARRQDRWDDALQCLAQAVAIEPRDVDLRVLFADTARYMRRYETFDREMAAAVALTPPNKLGVLPVRRALGPLESSGDMAPLRLAFDAQTSSHQLDDADAASYGMILAAWSHDPVAMSRLISSHHVEVSFNGIDYPDSWFVALAARMQGDDVAAKTAFAKARAEIEKRVLAAPGVGTLLSVLAIADAGLGNKEQAIEEAKRACDLNTFEVNNLDATTTHCHVAVVYAWLGETDLALAELDNLAERAAAQDAICVVTYGDLKLNPFWDPLRSDPRFEGLVQRLAPVAASK